MYTFDSRIRYSEVDNRGKLTLESLLDYFQDCSTFQAEDLGIGFAYLGQYDYAWVLNTWQIDVQRYPLLGERVKIATIPYDLRGFLGYRNFVLFDEKGERCACANTLWTMLNLKEGRPARIPEKVVEGYVLEPRLDMEYLPRKIALPKDGEEGTPILVAKHHLDCNQHVNNGQYVRMAEDLLPEGMPVHRLRVEYKAQAFLGDEIIPVKYQLEDGYAISLNDHSGAAYAVTSFSTKGSSLEMENL